MNNNGPNMEPCGTPDVRLSLLDLKPLKQTTDCITKIVLNQIERST
jgi:hypothetical protein